MATEAAIISWTPANMITVVLMVGLTFFVVAALQKAWKQKQTAQQGS
jgi:hypothetical protein